MRSKKIPFAILLVMLIVGLAAGQSIQTDPTESIRRGNARYSRAQYFAAIEEYERVQPEAGDIYSQALFNIGVCYYELWRTEDAIFMYKRAVVARGGRYPKALYALGIALEELKREAEAKEAYRRVVAGSANSETRAAHFRLGLILTNEGDYEKAGTHFTEAIDRETSPAGHNNLGVVLALKGRLHEAEREFEMALKQAEGEFTDATNNLKLCRSLLRAPKKDLLASMRLVAATRVPGRIGF